MKKIILAITFILASSFSYSNTSSLEVCDQIVFDQLFFRGVQKACPKVSSDPVFQVEVEGKQIFHEYVQNKCGKLYETDKYPVDQGSPRLNQAEDKFEQYISAEYMKYKSDDDFCEALSHRYKKILGRYLSYPE